MTWSTPSFFSCRGSSVLTFSSWRTSHSVGVIQNTASKCSQFCRHHHQKRIDLFFYSNKLFSSRRVASSTKMLLINTAPPAAGILVLSPSILTNNALPVMWWCQIQRYTLWPRVLGKSFARHLLLVLFILHVWMFLNHHEADSYFVAVVFCDNSVSSVVSLQDGIPAVLQRTHRLLLSHWRHLHWITLHSWPSCVLITSPVL